MLFSFSHFHIFEAYFKFTPAHRKVNIHIADFLHKMLADFYWIPLNFRAEKNPNFTNDEPRLVRSGKGLVVGVGLAMLVDHIGWTC